MKHRISIFRQLPTKMLMLVFVLMLPMVVPAQAQNTGSVTGFVYDGDGKSPIDEAVVILKLAKDKKDGKEYKSEPTQETGDYRIEDLPAGIYVAAVRIKSGKVYNTLSVLKIVAGKRLIRSFYLTPERPLAWLWYNPCGLAMILSGTAVVTKLIIDEEEEVSPTQL